MRYRRWGLGLAGLGASLPAHATLSKPPADDADVFDVYTTGDTIAIQSTQSGTCQVKNAAGTSYSVALSGSGTTWTATYTAGNGSLTGLLYLTCPGETNNRHFSVDATPHRKLWLDRNKASGDASAVEWTLADEYADHLNGSQRELAPPTGVDTALPTDWVHDTAWDYLLNQALPSHNVGTTTGSGTYNIAYQDEITGIATGGTISIVSSTGTHTTPQSTCE